MKEKVLKFLEANPGRYSSGQEICQGLGVTRTAVWKAVNSLKADGFLILSARRQGYMLSQLDDTISPGKITSLLHNKVLGQHIYRLDTVDSTNTYLKELAVKGAPEGTVIIAEEQTAGKGRLGRSFVSPKSKGIYMSVLLRPTGPMADYGDITAPVAVCTCQALEQQLGIKPQIKWVNDIYLNGRKVCGILTEAQIVMEENRFEYIVVGIGINVHTSDQIAQNPQLADICTNLSKDSAKPALRNQLIAAILDNLAQFYGDIQQNKQAYVQAYRQRLYHKGRPVTLSNQPEETYTIVDIDDHFGLVLQSKDNTQRTVTFGEISIIPK